MSRDWTKEELQAVSRAMKAMGYMSYEEFCADLEKLEQQKKSARVYRYYIQVPHMTADRLPAGYILFERWNSKPYCQDAGKQVFGFVDYSRELTEKEMVILGLEMKKA